MLSGIMRPVKVAIEKYRKIPVLGVKIGISPYEQIFLIFCLTFMLQV